MLKNRRLLYPFLWVFCYFMLARLTKCIYVYYHLEVRNILELRLTLKKRCSFNFGQKDSNQYWCWDNKHKDKTALSSKLFICSEKLLYPVCESLFSFWSQCSINMVERHHRKNTWADKKFSAPLNFQISWSTKRTVEQKLFAWINEIWSVIC